MKSHRIHKPLLPNEIEVIAHKSNYPKKSKKIHMDRFLAAQKWLKLELKWFKEAHARGQPYDMFHRRMKRNSYSVSKYNKARAVVKNLGLI